MKPIRVLLADKNFIVREGIKSILLPVSDIEVVEEAANGSELLHKIKELNPDVVLMDYQLPEFGMEGLGQLRQSQPGVNVIIISDKQEKEDILQVIDRGINHFILKECDREEIVTAIYSAVKGERFFCGRVIDAILEKHLPPCGKSAACNGCEAVSLSNREVEIIRYVAEGLTTKDISSKLFLSTHTVSTHRKNILKKLGARTTSEMVLFAVRQGLVQTE